MKVPPLNKRWLPSIYILVWWTLLFLALIFKWDSWPVSSFPMFTNKEDVVAYQLTAKCENEEKVIFLGTKLHRYFLYKHLKGEEEYLKKFIRLKFCHFANHCVVELSKGLEKSIVERMNLSEVCQ